VTQPPRKPTGVSTQQLSKFNALCQLLSINPLLCHLWTSDQAFKKRNRPSDVEIIAAAGSQGTPKSSTQSTNVDTVPQSVKKPRQIRKMAPKPPVTPQRRVKPSEDLPREVPSVPLHVPTSSTQQGMPFNCFFTCLNCLTLPRHAIQQGLTQCYV